MPDINGAHFAIVIGTLLLIIFSIPMRNRK